MTRDVKPRDVKPRVAFLVARCGEELVGGAESFCLQFASRLGAFCDVEILTTCAADYRTWANAYPAGASTIAGVTVRRFPADASRAADFDRLSRTVASDPARTSRADETRWQRAQGPVSSALLAYVREREPDYEAFVFFGYLYATTSLVLPLVAHKAVLVPFAHDEWMLQLPMWDAIFAAPGAIVCVSAHERDVLRRRFTNMASKIRIVPAGIEAPAERDAGRFRSRFEIDGRFLLYLGRVDRAKGVDVLLEDFRRYRAATFDSVHLVVAGTQHVRLPVVPGVIQLGTVDEQTKWDALDACDLVVIPSEYESLSLVLLEAWACAKPALVNARSSVLVGQCRRANGGVWYAGPGEFARALQVLDPHVMRVLGEQGRRYVAETYVWEDVIPAFAEVVVATIERVGAAL